MFTDQLRVNLKSTRLIWPLVYLRTEARQRDDIKYTKLTLEILLIASKNKFILSTPSLLANETHGNKQLSEKWTLTMVLYSEKCDGYRRQISLCSSLPGNIGLLGYFLRRVLEDAIMVKILMKMLIVSMYIPIDALMGSYGLSACTGYVSALLMIFCVSYNMKPPKITNPPYVAIDWRPAPTTEVAGRNKVPGNKCSRRTLVT